MKAVNTLLIAALAALAEARVIFTNTAFNPKAGEPFTIEWADNNGPVTILLKNGPSTALETVAPIGCKPPTLLTLRHTWCSRLYIFPVSSTVF
jgi:hypothetical protein